MISYDSAKESVGREFFGMFAFSKAWDLHMEWNLDLREPQHPLLPCMHSTNLDVRTFEGSAEME